MHKGRMERRQVIIVTMAIVSLFLLSGLYHGGPHNSSISSSDIQVQGSTYRAVSFVGTVTNASVDYSGNMNVVLIFNFSHQNGLNDLLSNLSNPYSSQYGKYLTASQFNAEFAPKSEMYNSAANYFRGFGLTDQQTFSNRLVLSITGSAVDISNAFHTNITMSTSGGQLVYSPSSTPMLPSWLSGSVSSVLGLTSIKPAFNLNIAQVTAYGQNTSLGGRTASSYAYPKPVPVQNGAQYLWGSYFQVAYNETPLLTQVMPTNAVIATILWGGSYTSNGKTVYTGAYDPADIQAYFNQSLPQSQPKPSIYGVPIQGAVAPGTSSHNDTSGAAIENTLDLEMAGSTAPGASIYNVYGPNSTLTDLSLAFETILSPPSGYAGLDNVSVISNSWGTNDTVSNAWNHFLQESQARGITVLASSGDSGDSFSSSKSVSNTEYVQFPSSVAYNTYGVVAVGGTNLIINTNTLALSSEQAWYEPPSTPGGDTLGTVGGISNVYTEPTWQEDSQANTVLNGAGRGVPDISAVANNTLIYYTNTTKPNNYIISGTSVSAPVVAGMMAEINAYRATLGLGNLGFINPSIYRLGTGQYDPSLSGGYSPSLKPFYDVTTGHNAVYSALPGYDLVTGMGSINAYNFASDLKGTKYNVSFVETGMNPANQWSVEVEGITYNSNGSYVNLSLINGTYGYSVPPVGYNVSDPVAGIFSVHGSAVQISLQFKRGYNVTFLESSLPQGTGWSVLSWNYTSSTFSNSLSLLFPNGTYNYSVKSADLNYYGSTGNFTVNGSILNLPVNFTRGTFNITFVEEGLPANYLWSVSNGTVSISSTNSTIRFTSLGGTYDFSVPSAGPYIANQTSLTLNTNGQNRTVYLNFSYGYFITFVASGVPAGTPWTILMGNYNLSSTNNTIVVEAQNGTHDYYAYYIFGSSTNSVNGNVTVNGHNVTVNIDFTASRTLSQYYTLYAALFMLGIAILIVGLVMLRKK